jgi:hypothetical protein
MDISFIYYNFKQVRIKFKLSHYLASYNIFNLDVSPHYKII